MNARQTSSTMFGLSKDKLPGFIASRPQRKFSRELTVNGRVLPLNVREHARATRITLRIEPGGKGLKVTIPPGLPYSEVEAFLDRQQGWLMTKLARFSDDNVLQDGARIKIRGVDHVIQRTGRLRGLTETRDMDGIPTIFVGGAEEHLGRRLANYLKKIAKAELDQRANEHARVLGRPIRSISYKDTKSRWGSCSSDGQLSFSWRIVMAPPHVIDYLAAHEVAHLAEMNHGPRFWRLCGELCPDTERAKKWLKQNGTLLQAIEF